MLTYALLKLDTQRDPEIAKTGEHATPPVFVA